MKVLVTPRSYKNPVFFKMLEDAGHTVVRNSTGGIFNKEELLRVLADCDGVIVGVDPIDAEVMTAAPQLKAIAKYGVGLDNIDLFEAERRGIRVSKTVGANSDAVADYAFALMMASARRVAYIDRCCRTGDWHKVITKDVYGSTLGILGFGAIGRGLAKRAAGFDMRVMAYDVFWNAESAAALGVSFALPEEIYRTCDFISLHLPLTDETRGSIGRAQLAQMKPDAILINTARGGLIDEPALLEALQKGAIGGAGLDAFEREPLQDPAWYVLDNVVLGSHCAASTAGAIDRMGRMATENIIRDLQ